MPTTRCSSPPKTRSSTCTAAIRACRRSSRNRSTTSKVGENVSVTLEPADAFGEYDPELVKIEAQDRLPPDVVKGMMFESYANPDDEQGGGIVFTVTDIADGKVVLDGNHAWAGKRVRFECRIIDIRPATPDEIQHGHAHGPEGHHHH